MDALTFTWAVDDAAMTRNEITTVIILAVVLVMTVGACVALLAFVVLR